MIDLEPIEKYADKSINELTETVQTRTWQPKHFLPHSDEGRNGQIVLHDRYTEQCTV